MTKFFNLLLASFISISILFTGCTNSSAPEDKNPGSTTQQAATSETTDKDKTNSDSSTNSAEKTGTETTEPQDTGKDPAENVTPIDLEKVKPNEAGKIMVVMFHRFIEKYTSGDKEYTTTFDDFRNLLQTLYDKGYRLVSMTDYLNNNISVPAGNVPMVFTFDDGTPGQFNLVEENGKLVINKQSAVGIMIEFSKAHPDFGLEGTFYVNLGGGTFEGKGTLGERLKYLTELGFEIGNHTYNHIDFKTVTTAEKVQMEVGANQKKIDELIPGYKMTTLALPLGHYTKDKSLRQYIAKGAYEGMQYENFALMEVGWDPAYSPVNKKFDPLSTHRVRSPGIKPADADLNWWFDNLSRSQEYVSDGNPETVTVPKDKEDQVDKEKLNNKKLITY